MAAVRNKQVMTEVFPFVGGLDLKTPALQLPPGCCIQAQNFERDINGGYRRMYGYERFDGRAQPHLGIYYNLECTLTGAVAAGNIVTGATSGATGVVLQVNGTTEIIVTDVAGTFTVGETLNVSASPVGTLTAVYQTGAKTPLQHATYLNEAATYYRQFIQPVPGSNPVRGVMYYNGKLYAVRDNVGATAGVMYVASSGSSTTVALTIASPGVVNWVGHNLIPGQAVTFSTTGALPTGLTAGTTYYVANAGISANSFEVAATVGGAPINFTGTQSGTQTCASAQGWQQISFGREIQFAQYQSSVTITIASPGVVTWTGHKLANGQAVIFEPASGAILPTGITAGVAYYVVAAATNTFEIAATPGGTAINTTGSSSGTITCTVTYTQISAGQTITGGTSGATAVVQRALLRTGTWSTAPVGSLVFDSVTGAFQNGEALIVGGNAQVATTTVDTAIALNPGGRVVSENYTFTGLLANFYLYFADGKNFISEWDGVRLVPIRTGMTVDTPNHLKTWENMLLGTWGSSVQVSGIGQPYSWTVLTGAGELSIGDSCTALLERPSNQSSGGGAIAIYTGSATTNMWNTWVLYGSSTANFQLVLTGPGAGAAPYTAQNIGDGYSLDSKGVVKMEQTLNYGNFEMSVVTRAVQPIVDSHRGMATASCIVRATDQYRVFYNDGTGLIVYILGKQTPTMMGDILTTDAADIMQFDFSQGTGIYFNTVISVVDNTGVERIFAGASNGYVYELERGSSFDGENINAFLLMAFNSSKTPRNRKHYHRSVLQAVVQNTAQVSIGYDLDYGSYDTQPGSRSSSGLTQTGGLWDQNQWDTGVWDAPYLYDYVIDTPGNGRNMALLIYANNAIDYPYTIQSMISHYSIGRLER
ncbi:MAG: hypothetical protein KGI47_10070 [Betaproteobacteria bacterium]|nr:hypothetical protein [Betaproteobacteria bacterium]